MHVRLTFLSFLPEYKEEVKRIYLEEVVPVVRQQKGNLNVMLLEPTNMTDSYISITEWENKADGDAYESSGTYRNLVDKVKEHIARQPELKTYNAITVGSMSAV
ncbi:MAG: antibiotic biosynthesis monooxygenase [Flavisolibacter sp.]|nr:antibiotic biosynthesis monooxygenase [Flavisolibacter sp.]MBD0284695.1 antibiotic biosynthesis monooxygenase [Flavisolibacter sp.]MBD0352515.1 antibiotic biosynthesis monooxygenase [Flavisolibacter sp.]MBD0364551.1 antibiotic biosynthesis monooxygenase [Flavisolibacter sp.]